MLKSLKRENLLQLLEILAEEYDLQVPLNLPDGTRQLGLYGSGELSLCGPLLQRKPTSLLFPQTELLLSINPDDPAMIPQGDLAHNLYHLGKMYGDCFVERVVMNSIISAWGLSDEERSGYLLAGDDERDKKKKI